jgi:hypothetical protein
MASDPARKRIGLRGESIQSRRMAEKCNWIVFQAHPRRFEETEDEHPDFFGVFVVPASRREPEMLLGEVLTNRKLFLAQITGSKSVPLTDDWGMNERLKAQMNEQGYGMSLTKIHGSAKVD